MKEISFFTDIFDLFGFFIPGALIMLLLYPLVASPISESLDSKTWEPIKKTPKWIVGILLVMAAISIGVLLRTPSSWIQWDARDFFASDALFEKAKSAVEAHFGSTIPNDPDSLRTMATTVADETSIAPDNERFNRMLLFTRNMGAAFSIAALTYLARCLAVAILRVAGSRRDPNWMRAMGSPSLKFAALTTVVSAIMALAFYYTYWDLQSRSSEAVASQCLLALHPLPEGKKAVAGAAP